MDRISMVFDSLGKYLSAIFRALKIWLNFFFFFSLRCLKVCVNFDFFCQTERQYLPVFENKQLDSFTF